MTKRIICTVCVLFILISTSFAANKSFENINIIDELAFFDGMAAVKNNGKWGYIDKSDNLKIDFKYTEAGCFSEGLAFVKDAGVWRCVDKLGQSIFTLECDKVFPFSDGIARYMKGGLYGFVNKTGEIICEPKWTDAHDAKNGFIVVSEETLYGYADYNGELFIEEKYEEAYDFTNNSAYVISNGIGELINAEGDTIYSGVCSDVSEGLAKIVQSEDDIQRYGFVNEFGTVVIWPIWDETGIPSEGRIAVKKDGKWGYIDFTGKECSEFIWDFAAPFKEGMARVAKLPEGETIPTSFVYSGYTANFDYTFINTDGAVINDELSYKGARDFSDGRAAVSNSDLWGFIDTNGTLVIPCTYSEVSDFSSNNAVVTIENVYAVCDDKGTLKSFYAAGEERPAKKAENVKDENKTFRANEKEPKSEKRSIISYAAIVISSFIILYCAFVSVLRFAYEARRKKRALRKKRYTQRISK